MSQFTLPPLSTFTVEQTEQVIWTSFLSQPDCGFSIRGDNNLPSATDYDFLSKAVTELDSLIAKAHQYISFFCPSKTIGENTPYALIELSVGSIQKTTVFSIYVNYLNDCYGLWTVDFTWDAYNKWWPVAFRRENW